MGLKKMIIALDYREYIVKKIIKAFKYPPYIKSLKKVLSSILITAIQKFPNDISYLKKNNFVLIPIPLSQLKLAQRGFNQSELLAIELSQKLSLKYQPQLLKKNKNSKSQTNLNFDQRKANVQNVFVVKSNNCPPNIILVDDICTTGATLQAASHALRQAGAKEIWAFVIAKG
ncbi:ComF family protein [bacterium]|nr:ComF family protein [bacterium]